MDTPAKITIEISPGELLDRVCIACVKGMNVPPSQVEVCQVQHDRLLQQVVRLRSKDKLVTRTPRFFRHAMTWLRQIHMELWELEDKVRSFEPDEGTCEEMLGTYMRITQYNDVRARIKRKVDEVYRTDSELREVKSHEFKGTIYPDVFLGNVPPDAPKDVLFSV